MPGNIKVIAYISPKPGCEAALERATLAVVASSRTEPGCLRYDLWREPGHEQRYVIDELYVDFDAYQAHRETAHYAAFRTAIADLLAQPPLVSASEAIDIAE